MFSAIWNACGSLLTRVKKTIKTWTKPAIVTLAVSAITDLSHSKTDLLVENVILRQQLIVLKRSVKRPKFTTGDRIRLTLLARLTSCWQSALHIVQPDTILRWHRDMFKRYWKLKSTAKSREPRIPHETIELIKQIARENTRRTAQAGHQGGQAHDSEIYETSPSNDRWSKLVNLSQEPRSRDLSLRLHGHS